jgi:tetratricopeptide (TPR) repeat protein
MTRIPPATLLLFIFTTHAFSQTTAPTDSPQQLPPEASPPQAPGEPAATQPADAGTRIDPSTMSLEQLIDTARQLLQTRTQENARRAIVLAETALRRDPQHLEALTLMAEIQDMAGDVHTARTYYMRVLDQNRADFRANLGIGRTHLRSKLWRQAVPYLEQALQAAPPDRRLEALTLLARAYQGRGDRNKAVEIAREAIQLDGEGFGAWEIMIECLMEMRDFDSAAREAQRLEEVATQRVKQDPLKVDGLQTLARAYEVRIGTLRTLHRDMMVLSSAGTPIDQVKPGMNAGAASTLRQIIELTLRQNELSGLLLRHQMLELARKTIEFEPENAANYIQLGRIYFDIGDRVNAAEQFTRALELDSGNAEAQQYLQALGSPDQSQR